MTAYIPDRDTLKEFIKIAVQETVKEALPEAIRKATRKKWLNTDEVMKLLQCSRRHVQYLRDTEALPFSQHGRTIRYDIDEIEEYLNNHKVSKREND